MLYPSYLRYNRTVYLAMQHSRHNRKRRPSITAFIRSQTVRGAHAGVPNLMQFSVYATAHAGSRKAANRSAYIGHYARRSHSIHGIFILTVRREGATDFISTIAGSDHTYSYSLTDL